jgi:hypothetical protein
MTHLLGRSSGSPIFADRFFVGPSVLGLLSAAAEDLHLVCAVDDAERVDRESAQAATGALR